MFKPGERIKFTTPYGSNPGTHTGTVLHRMAPCGFLSGLGFSGHYEVAVFIPYWGRTYTMVVTDEMIQGPVN